jgi:hypothetical protein
VSAPKLPGSPAVAWSRSQVTRLAAVRPSADLLRIVALWAAWLAIICAFQIVVEARLQPNGTDKVLGWTGTESGAYATECQPDPGAYRPRLADPNMNEHVAYDSEYYISIAASGYDDPTVYAYVSGNVLDGKGGTKKGVVESGVPVCAPYMVGWTSLNYAFLPGYPMAMRPFMALEEHLPFTRDLSETGRATLAGIIVSALGGLLAMLALARMMAYLERRRQLTIPARSRVPTSRVGTALWYGAGALAGIAAGIAAGLITGHPEGFLVGLLVGWLAVDLLIAFLDGGRKPSSETGDESAKSPWGGAAGLRAALYLLVFPTGFYLAQVYTEGLFIGLAFMACALAVEKKVVAAAVFAFFAALVRTPGVFLVLPLTWAALQVAREHYPGMKDWRSVVRWVGVPIVAAAAPVVAFVAWYQSWLGHQFNMVEDEYFTRKFDPGKAWDMWMQVWNSLATGVDRTNNGQGWSYFAGYNRLGSPLEPSSNVYIALELLALVLGIAACVWLVRRMPGVALFGLAVIVLSAGSSAGAPQGMIRYVLAVPAIFLVLASLGRSAVFDRAWVLGSTLVMGMLVALFTFNYWVS